MSAAISELIVNHPIVVIRCNPVDREWLIGYLCEIIGIEKFDYRWRVHQCEGTTLDRLRQPIERIGKEASAPKRFNCIFDNYLSILASIDEDERWVIYEMLSDLYLKGNNYRLIVLQTDNTPLPIQIEGFFKQQKWLLPDRTEVEELYREFNFESDDRSVRLAAGLSREELRRGLIQATRKEDPHHYLEAYRNERLSLLGVKYAPVPKLKKIVGLDSIVAAVDDLKFGFSERARSLNLPFPKGWVLAGVPGTGKTYSAMSIASILGYPMLMLEVDKLIVGGVEAMRRVLDIAQSCAPCILFADEIEKMFGFQNKPILGMFLSWLQDKDFPVFVIGTLNRIDDLPAEIIRAGRFDRVWEVPAPDESARVEQFLYFLSLYDSGFKNLAEEERVFSDDEWQLIADITNKFVGAEIQQVVINTVYYVRKNFGDRAITYEDILSHARGFKTMYKRNEEQVLKIENRLAGIADSSTEANKSILAKREFDIYA